MRLSVIELSRHAQHVLPVERQRVRVHPVTGGEGCHPQLLTVTLEPLAQDIQQALRLQFLAQVIQYNLCRFRAVNRFEALPQLLLRALDESQHQHRVKRLHLIVTVLRRAIAVIYKDIPTLRGQVINDRVFEPGFDVLLHDYAWVGTLTLRTSILPVVAAVISAVRYSTRRSMADPTFSNIESMLAV